MAINPINNSVAVSQATPQKPAVTPAPNGDTVKISSYAQAKLLKQQGANVSEISLKLGLDTKTVKSWFETETAQAPPAPLAPPPNKPVEKTAGVPTVKEQVENLGK